MRRWRKRSHADPVDRVIDLREPAPVREYSCTTIALDVVPVRDEAREQWEAAASLITYPTDLEDWRADRRRDELTPGHLSAAVLLDVYEN